MVFKKIFNVLIQEGFGSVIYKIKRKINIKSNRFFNNIALKFQPEDEKELYSKVKNYLNRETEIQSRPIASLKVAQARMRLNIVTESINKDALFGGVGTSLILATLFANRQNIPLRIITRLSKTKPQDYDAFLRFMKIPRPTKVEFFSDYGNTQRLEITDQDVFMSTSWWSSKVIQNLNQRPSFFYLLQDVEFFFYPNDDDHWECKTMLEQKNIHYLINTKILQDYYRNNSFIDVAEKGAFFEPAFPEHLYQASKNSFVPKVKKILFFYSRPHSGPNLFKTGLKLLNEAIVRGVINSDEWDIYFAGNEVPEITLTTGLKPKMLGQMSWEAYSAFTKTVDLCFSLMYTPHPSYPPLHIAASGGVVLTNKYPGKDHLYYSKNIICENLDRDSMLGGFQKAVDLVQNSKQRQLNYQSHQIERDWGKTLESTMQYMAEHI